METQHLKDIEKDLNLFNSSLSSDCDDEESDKTYEIGRDDLKTQQFDDKEDNENKVLFRNYSHASFVYLSVNCLNNIFFREKRDSKTIVPRNEYAQKRIDLGKGRVRLTIIHFSKI